MIIKNLKLTDFRNHKKLSLSFSESINLVYGPNGSGKTNILEAVNALSTGKSFKAEYDRDMIKHESEFARVEAGIEEKDEVDTLEMLILKSQTFANASSKKVKINKVAKTLHSFTGKLKSVLFTPEDIEIVTGSPSLRRKYLDNILATTDSQYRKTLSNYTKVIRQRNKLLENILETSRGRDQLHFWDKELIKHADIIYSKRKDLINHLQNSLPGYIHNLDKVNSEIQINYDPSLLSYEKLVDNHERDIMAKTTLSGPHRDDFSISLNSSDTSKFASRGQQRTVVLALKLAEIDYIYEKTEIRPILLLDDIFSELDPKHKENVVKTVKTHQCLITTADKDLELKLLSDSFLIEL